MAIAVGLPPDVRRWLCPAATGQIIPGYAPGLLSPSDLLGQKAALRA